MTFRHVARVRRQRAAFAWLRPNDLIWNYWVNNYLLGKKPPAFDILYWNADTTRMPAHLHRDFLETALENKLVTAGGATVLGVPVDLSQVTVDAYVVGGVADHITPWQSCYRTTQLLGGTTRFVLSTSGHIAALVNPTTNAKSSFRTAKDNPADPLAWVSSADTPAGQLVGRLRGLARRPLRGAQTGARAAGPWSVHADRVRPRHLRPRPVTALLRT